METATLIVMLALVEYFYFTGRVGAWRGKYKVDAPKCTGDEMFEKGFRVQQNTMEQLVIFIPGTYAFAYYVSQKWVWVPAALFLIGRLLFSHEYLTKPDSRVPGMAMTLLANATLVIGTLIALGLKFF
ncbi:MAG: MAPEG family protein [Xanthomonadales bacterium]|nr:MAPEG family protein [Gammaproteobacteria bacterium]NNE06441.1 MAPEG family protein [Xanthomonadales bacterium]NNL95124.1 MAPEG family protein [Xanthomonadales bacterium]